MNRTISMLFIAPDQQRQDSLPRYGMDFISPLSEERDKTFIEVREKVAKG